MFATEWRKCTDVTQNTGASGGGAAHLGEGLVEGRVFILLHLLGWSLPDGLDVVHQLPVPHGLLNLQQDTYTLVCKILTC